MKIDNLAVYYVMVCKITVDSRREIMPFLFLVQQEHIIVKIITTISKWLSKLQILKARRVVRHVLFGHGSFNEFRPMSDDRYWDTDKTAV